MVNYECHGKCGYCIAKHLLEHEKERRVTLSPEEIRGEQEEKRENIKKVMGQFNDSSRVFLTGGEPFYEKDFSSLVQRASECFDEVFIDTNGLPIPLDIKKAEDFFKDLPSDVFICLSLDDYHAAVDPHLQERIYLLEELAKRGICKTAYNMRSVEFSRFERPRNTQIGEVVRKYGLEDKYLVDKEHRNTYCQKGNKMKLKESLKF